MARIDTLGHFLTDVADAIRTKTGSSDTISAEDFDTEIENIPSGGSSSEEDVIFYDYDGTKLHSYSKTDFLALNEMPSNPAHSGLTSQGWNWALNDAKTYVTNYDKLNIGQIYNTDDDKTRIYISLEDDGRLSPCLGFAVNGTVTVNWGDGSEPELITGTNTTKLISTKHIYNNVGDYTITLYSESPIYLQGNSDNGSYLLHDKENMSTTNTVYQNAIQKIELNDNVQINASSFCNCYSLSSITIPNNITDINTNVFKNCYSLSSVTIPSTVTSISNNAFYSCHSLSSVTIPSTVTSISSTAFSNCVSLLSVTIPSGVIRILSETFSGCRSLSSVTIPSGVIGIGANAFNGCYSLSSVTIPDGVRSIEGYAFSNCYSLSSVTIPSTITSIDMNVFSTCTSLSSVIIPSGVTSISNNAFSNCTLLSSVTIPSTVTSISNNAFSGCYSLSSVTIPSGVTSIGANAFSTCRSLSSVIIPSTVTSIGANAFSTCSSVFYYDFSQHISIPTLGNAYVFNVNAPDYKIIVPDNLYEDWITAANWSNVNIVNHIIKKSDWDNL